MIEILTNALGEMGVEEIVHTGHHNEKIVQYFKEAGHQWVTDDETAWCSAFLNAMCARAGYERTGALNARSWLKVGEEINNPLLGDIVILWRGSPDSWKGHVGIFINYDEDGKNINVLGGNQANQVNIQKYNKGRLLGFRRLAKL